MNKKKIFSVLGLMVLGAIVLIGGLILFFYIFPEQMEFNFYINETGERLEGRVYFEDIQSKQRTFLGNTNEGELRYDLEELYPGNIFFIGEYEGIPFEYEFAFSKVFLDHGSVDYILTDEEIQDLKFGLTKKDLIEIKGEMFDFMNYEREKRGIENLKRNFHLDEIAQEYAMRMFLEGFYAHNDPQGGTLYDRLQEKKIFYVTATENLNLVYVLKETNLAEENVYGWIKSPGHSVAILDTNKPIIWNNVGLGIDCGKLGEDIYHTCYSVAVFAGFNTEYLNEELKKDYITIIRLYPEEYDYDYDVQARIVFNSTSSARIILTSDQGDFNRLVKRNSLRGEIFRKDTSNYNEELTLKKGYSLLIHSRSRDINYNLSIEYNV